MTEKTEIAVMTPYELQQLVETSVRRILTEFTDMAMMPKINPKPEKKRYVYGIKGIAEIFNCSLPTANRIKKSGRISRAITQVGRKVVIDVEMALELAKESKFGRR